MGTASSCDADRISALPDDLLHSILVRLPSTAEAARTSVLSRRWRRVWARLPELSLSFPFPYLHVADADPCGAQDRVDAALAAHDAAAAATVVLLRRLEISMWLTSRAAAARVPPWLRFASRRLAGELRLSLPCLDDGAGRPDDDAAIVLPVCERVTAIKLEYLANRTLRFSLPPAGEFAALSTMTISMVRVDGRELEAVVASRCPRLKELVLLGITLQGGGARGLSIRSGSLEHLDVGVMRVQGRLHVVAPELRTLALDLSRDVSVAAAKLSGLGLHGNWCYDPERHRFEGAGARLRWLSVPVGSRTAALMSRFSTVEHLNLRVYTSAGGSNYNRFLRDLEMLAKCEVLEATFLGVVRDQHDILRTMLQLLKECPGTTKKLVVSLCPDDKKLSCPLKPRCPDAMQTN